MGRGIAAPRMPRPPYADGGLVNLPAGASGGPMALRMANVVDPRMMNDYLNSPSGEKAVINHISRNATIIKQILDSDPNPVAFLKLLDFKARASAHPPTRKICLQP